MRGRDKIAIGSIKAWSALRSVHLQAEQRNTRVQEAALATVRNQVKQKQAALAQAQINLDHTTIRSP